MPILALALAAWQQRWVTDDAFIDFRVVANLHSGLGPVWNAGERVEAYTSPLWIALLWLVSAVFSFVKLEWTAVILGIAGTLGGMVAAARASWLLWRTAGGTGFGLPLGLLVIAALRPMWDFASSGLETGLVFAWLGVCFLLLVRVFAEPARARPALTAVAIGLGPLVRPDLAIFAAGFALALLLAPQGFSRRHRVRLLLWMLALPVTYQLFRMGYFASLEPNTAIAKEAGASNWGRGWAYLKDFVGPYALLLPLLALFAYVAIEARGSARIPRRLLLLGVAPVVCGLLHALYIVRVGGDFMHARMLLPSLFGVLLPVTVIVPRAGGWRLAVALLVVPWAVVCAATLRAPYANRLSSGPVDDERAFYVAYSKNAHPITLHDYRLMSWARDGQALHALAEDDRALVLRFPLLRYQPLRPNGPPAASAPTPVVTGAGTVGLIGYAAGPHVHVVDEFGLADPIAARTRIGPIVLPPGTMLPARGPDEQPLRLPAGQRAGHEKYLPTEWIAARFGPPGTTRFSGISLSATDVAAARRALGCPPMHRLLTAVTAPMTFHRFMSNVGDSFSLNGLRFSAAPGPAAAELCRG